MTANFRIGRFELRTAARALLCDGQAVRLGARAYDILLALIERRDRVVEFDELLDLVWPGLAVEENNLSVQISTLRKILGPEAVSTVRGRGYRFTAAVKELPTVLDADPPAAPAASPMLAIEAVLADAPLRPSVAVVPFPTADMPSAPIGIGDVLADQLIGTLSTCPLLDVISRLSTSVFRDRTTPLPRISALLDAHFIVSGSCWREGSRLTASIEMADTKTQRVLWSRVVSDRIEGVLHADSNLVLELAGGILQAIIAAEIRHARSRPFEDIDSHTLLLSGIGLLYRLSRKDFDLARTALETLRDRAPGHPLPLAWLARWHLFRVVQGWSESRDDDGRRALDFAQRALDIDPDSSLALTMLGNVHTSYLRDLDTAEALYAAATQINPNESLAWLQWGNARSFKGDGRVALSYVDRAIRLSPLDPARHFYDSIAASAALAAGENERAVTAARASLTLNDHHVSTHRVLAIALSLSGRIDEARGEVRRLLELEPGLTVEGFVARSPGAASGLAQRFGNALADAGLPRNGLGGTTVSSTVGGTS